MIDYPQCPVCGQIQDRDLYKDEGVLNGNCEMCGAKLCVLMEKKFHVYLDNEEQEHEEV